jgi:hypothetical protein
VVKHVKGVSTLHCEISIGPMSQMGHSRPIQRALSAG